MTTRPRLLKNTTTPVAKSYLPEWIPDWTRSGPFRETGETNGIVHSDAGWRSGAEDNCCMSNKGQILENTKSEVQA